MSKNSLYKQIGFELKLGSLVSVDEIQSLWEDYGKLLRLKFSEKNAIVKHVKLPKQSSHPKGWNTKLSHQRKIHSYQVEVNWYENFSQFDNRCKIPKGYKTFQNENEWLIVMQDLEELDMHYVIKEANKTHLSSCLSWLANFHAKYMNTKSELLWEVGTYWHLDTRPDELEVLEDKELKAFSKVIDEELKACKYQTIVHGDAKLANFCFSKDGSSCAAVDFQYVGHGCGMKDLILFMSSAVEPKDCESMQEWIIDRYFEELHKALSYYHPNIDAKDVEKQWRPMFAIAWADFQRFIKGWSPNHFKINAYTEELTSKALAYLKSK